MCEPSVEENETWYLVAEDTKDNSSLNFARN